MNKLKQQRIVMCRVCKGDHWTTKCPYKDSLEPLQKELLSGGGGNAAGSDSETGDGGKNVMQATAEYIPYHQ